VARERFRVADSGSALFKIKICGITSPKDAQLVALAGADAIGLNFYEASARHVTLEAAQKIAAVTPARVKKVGVFVNAPVPGITEAVEALKLDCIQLHGDEPPDLLLALPNVSIIKAFRFGEQAAAEVPAYINACQSGRQPEAFLVDAHKAGEYGGTGETVDWSLLAASKQVFGDAPLILAGGLTPFNVEEAILAVRPAGVDTASGVESKPGSKDPLLVRAFVNAAKKAFQRLEQSGPKA